MPTLGVKIRVFVPKEVLDSAAVVRNIQHVMNSKTAPEIRKEFEKTTATWDQSSRRVGEMGPVNFQTEHYFGVRHLWVKVYTYSLKYRFVNSGTDPHPIPILPRRAKMLRFQTGYRQKSRPRTIASYAGGKFGTWKSYMAVNHPGIREPREFDKTIAEEYTETFQEDIQEAIKSALP